MKTVYKLLPLILLFLAALLAFTGCEEQEKVGTKLKYWHFNSHQTFDYPAIEWLADLDHLGENVMSFQKTGDKTMNLQMWSDTTWQIEVHFHPSGVPSKVSYRDSSGMSFTDMHLEIPHNNERINWIDTLRLTIPKVYSQYWTEDDLLRSSLNPGKPYEARFTLTKAGKLMTAESKLNEVKGMKHLYTFQLALNGIHMVIGIHRPNKKWEIWNVDMTNSSGTYTYYFDI